MGVLIAARPAWSAAEAQVVAQVHGTWSRVYLGVHYPTDVLASAVVVPVVAFAAARVTSVSRLNPPRVSLRRQRECEGS